MNREYYSNYWNPDRLQIRYLFGETKERGTVRKLEFVDSDVRATDEQWAEYEKRDDLFSFYPPDIDIIYVVRIKREAEEQ